ncbi:hypothetical protein PC116_g17687 [Phytophthora cactorum]|uniref:Uncharacterized protein n=1 Tax=Phytophthora cactorum TaxID=29920 RepID=A0A8T1FXU6_9STRA|nr:hypothetical protein Pcac1_g7144 [Phytophthora cactorum]KAG2818050.1 hypothetical protein PC111_g12461 [Phytophthora cactorum]KAG2818512.1 hypothetical protein PC112_g12586 [Phytophthora cactorum]KAG2855311.1 hypothetical protein PC113_g12547 [Phytophthora cactorum]KAG2911749.1 hypothetical protein PC114_g9236 [Phytophthora cactorum]
MVSAGFGTATWLVLGLARALYSALLWYSKHGGCKFDNYDPVLQIVICHLGCSQ